MANLLVLEFNIYKTQKRSDELPRNITIKPGYANMKVWTDGQIILYRFRFTNYQVDGQDCELAHHLSFVDCPGTSRINSYYVKVLN